MTQLVAKARLCYGKWHIQVTDSKHKPIEVIGPFPKFESMLDKIIQMHDAGYAKES